MLRPDEISATEISLVKHSTGQAPVKYASLLFCEELTWVDRHTLIDADKFQIVLATDSHGFTRLNKI